MAAAGLKARLLVTAAVLLLALLARQSRGAGPSQPGHRAITWRRLAEDVLAAEQCGRSGTVDELANCLNSYLNQTAAAAVPATRAEVVLGGGGGAAGWGGYVKLRGLVPPGGSVPASNSSGSEAQPTIEWCAGACMSTSLCNSFLFCEQQGGCPADLGANLTARPHGSCELRWQEGKDWASGNAVVAVKATGYVGGALIPTAVATAPDVEGFTAYRAFGMISRYDYLCADSLIATGCLLRGTPEMLAGRCAADPNCTAMIQGIGISIEPANNMTMFKGGPGPPLNMSSGQVAQNTVTYLKDGAAVVPLSASWSASGADTGIPPPSPANGQDVSGEPSSGGLSAGAIAGIVVGAAAGAALLAAGAALVVKRRGFGPLCGRQAAQPSASLQTDSAHSGEFGHTPPGSGSAGTSKGSGTGRAGALPPDRRAALEHDIHARCPAGACSTPPSAGAGGVPSPRLPAAILGHDSELAVAGVEACLVEQPPSATLDNDTHGEPSALEDSASLLQRLGEDSWESCVVPFGKISFCKRADGSFVRLGTGSFGEVYKVLVDDIQPLAAKVIDLGENSDIQDSFIQEAATLRRLRHRHIVSFAGVSVHDTRGVILMELMEGRDLFTLLNLKANGSTDRMFGWHQRGKRVALHIALALHYLHARKLTHFDIKSSNVLLTKELVAKLADVGFARLLVNTHHSVSGGSKGTFSYMAPELIVGESCNSSVDIYSFGVLLWEICTGEHPLRGRNRTLSAPGDCPEGVIRLVADSCSTNPASRPTAKQLVERLGELVRP